MKILDYAWHQVHLYRLHALPAEFTLVRYRGLMDWNEAQRPKPPNFAGVLEADEVQVHDYDLALLHLDQWCDVQPQRALPFRCMVELTRDLPQVLIMHGTPDSPRNRLRVLQMIGDLPVVCNSYQAAREWDNGEGRTDRYGLPQFRAIIHGYQVEEFFNYCLEGRRAEVATICSGADFSAWYHGIPLLKRLRRERSIPLAWYGPAGDRDWLPNYDAYRDMLASTLVYFSPTRRAPMPGARTEALLSGCCVVSVPGNDWEQYIEDGVDGFIARDYMTAREVLRDLLAHPQMAYEVGQRGREKALQIFNHHRYVAEWLALLGELGVIS